MFEDQVVIIARPAYFYYLDNLTNLISLRGENYHELTPEQALGSLELLKKARVVITIHSMVPAVFRIMNALRGHVPTLTVQDGIIEYKHSAHEGRLGTFRYRPLHTDHIACFGTRSALILESYGIAPERIHVTGSPRFHLNHPDVCPAHGSILIASANRPGFNRSQLIGFYRLLDKTVTALTQAGHELRFRLGRGTGIGKLAAIEPLASDLGDDLVARIRALPQSTLSLAEDFAQSRMLITTPSTISLEAMACGLPVAHFLMDDETVYLNTAWFIHPSSNPQAVVNDMLNPPVLKKAYQQMVFKENILQGDAAQKILTLIDNICVTKTAGHP